LAQRNQLSHLKGLPILKKQSSGNLVIQHSSLSKSIGRGLIKWKNSPHILIAEDVPFNYKIVILFLEKLNCNISVAENGLAVLDLLDKKHFDLILMDCQMPGLDGYQTARAIRKAKEKTYSNIPIIATTANATEDDRKRCLASGMDDYISKPLSFANLKEALEKHLRHLIIQNTKELSIKSTPSLKKESIDWTVLAEFDGIESDSNIGSMELVAIFLDNIEKRMDLLASSIREKNHEKTLMAAHAIKSSSSYIGATEVKKICNLIRINIEAENFENISRLFDDLTLEQVHIRNLLERHYPKNGI
jgi:CheY-like chemotaxis protein/HPt (histidine-containing phosphotransfer) domain-containing protein